MCIASHCIEVSDFLGYDMPRMFLNKLFRVVTENTEEWLYLMNEPGASMLHIYVQNKQIHFAEYDLSVDSFGLNHKDEKRYREQCQACLFDAAVAVHNAVDGIVTELSLYETGNGRRLYEKHWDVFPTEEFEQFKKYAFQLQKRTGKYDELLCTTFL